MENKSIGLSIHYRRVLARQVRPLIHKIQRWWKSFPEASYFELRHGKKVLEIRPTLHWNKGSAVLWLKRFFSSDALIVYAGDDETDEDAFKVLGPKDLSIQVGPKRVTCARYYVRHPRDVALLLEKLLALPPKEVRVDSRRIAHAS